MVTLVDPAAVLCRHPCVTRVGRAILAAGPSVLAQLWPEALPVREAQGHIPASTDLNAEEVFASFKAGVAKQISADDAQTHLDLAVAYGEMGLRADAIREAAIALGERAPVPIANRAMKWLFAPGRASPDALPTLVASLRGS